MNFQILGAGAWGTAMAIVLGRGGHKVTLIPRSTEQVRVLSSARANDRYLSGFALPEAVEVRPWDPMEGDADTVHIVACPSFGMRYWAEKLGDRQHVRGGESMTVISLTKGLERETLLLPTQVLEEHLEDCHLFALSGPNFASEVAQGLPTAAVLAGDSMSSRLRLLQEAFGTSHFRIYTSDDRYGVELGGALKNVYAIGMGICEGLHLGDNAKAALITRSLHEMLRLVPLLRGEAETPYGLSGVGDLVATCYGRLSRNRAFGEAVGRGEPMEKHLKGSQGVVEGYFACENFHALFRKHEISGPILEQIYAVLYRKRAPSEALQALMSRELKPEKTLAEASRE